MTICSLCLPALVVPTPLPILQISNAGSLHPCSIPFLQASRDDSPAIDQVGLLHHSSLYSLSLSAENCPLCKVILQKIEKFIEDFEQMERNAYDRAWWIGHLGHALPVEWTLRLVQRVDGADGFVVLARSKNEQILYMVDVFGFCVEPKESMYSIANLSDRGASVTGRVRGARVGPDAGSKRTLNVAAGWIQDCVSNHNGCRPPPSPLPSRLLDLDAFDDPSKIRLWETKGTTRSDSYVTLSHCWGVDTSHHVKTTHATLPSHLNTIFVQELPQTFRDAIKVTRHLGIRFLWIDSLCICQDDADDWAREAAAMQRVYAGAFLTISADGAPGSAHGFLQRQERRHVPITLKFTPDNTDPATATRPKETNVPAYAFEFPAWKSCKKRVLLALMDQPLSSRAWAMQERLLSNRMLHFTSKELFFECNCHFLSEDGIRILGRWNSLDPGGDKTLEDLPSLSPVSVHQVWDFILEEFTTRQLTVKTDWFPALSGLAAQIKGKLGADAARDRASDNPQDVEYVAGLWSNTLVKGLGWGAFSRTQEGIAFPDERPLPGDKGYIAPTWSPASFDGRSVHNTAPSWADMAVVTGYSVTPKTIQNPLGEVVDGWISLRAPLVKLEQSELPDTYKDVRSSQQQFLKLCTPHSDRYGRIAVEVDRVDEIFNRLETLESTFRHAIAARRDRSPVSTPYTLPRHGEAISPENGAASVPSTADRPGTASLSHFANNNVFNTTMDIPLSHSSTTGNLLRSAPAKALLGHYPADLFLHIELRRPIPDSLQLIPVPTNQINLPTLQPDETDVLIQNFFRLVHHFHPILDQRAFHDLYNRTIDDGLRPDLASALVLVVLALGAVAAATPNLSEPSWHPGIQYFTPAVRLLLAESLCSFGGNPILPQALYLAALYYSYISRPLLAWRLVHMASTDVQHYWIRSEKLLRDGQGGSQDQSILRVFWAILVLECDILAEHHLPRSGIEKIVDKLPYPWSDGPSEPYMHRWLADLSSRRLLNRIHYAFSVSGLCIGTRCISQRDFARKCRKMFVPLPGILECRGACGSRTYGFSGELVTWNDGGCFTAVIRRLFKTRTS
ncbi:hypothetical protein CDV31_005461 [Fusarium ambrosium]|uniref:Heterokaryon incompatibility domain-containing protein n=1 Tax=Fusarium ambrosium TaxID=131363 RepID=A0A428UJL5_9HYPO|nr:hypothetical protein CDV31_005461 [Fusarium ambrosium]